MGKLLKEKLRHFLEEVNNNLLNRDITTKEIRIQLRKIQQVCVPKIYHLVPEFKSLVFKNLGIPLRKLIQNLPKKGSVIDTLNLTLCRLFVLFNDFGEDLALFLLPKLCERYLIFRQTIQLICQECQTSAILSYFLRLKNIEMDVNLLESLVTCVEKQPEELILPFSFYLRKILLTAEALAPFSHQNYRTTLIKKLFILFSEMDRDFLFKEVLSKIANQNSRKLIEFVIANPTAVKLEKYEIERKNLSELTKKYYSTNKQMNLKERIEDIKQIKFNSLNSGKFSLNSTTSSSSKFYARPQPQMKKQDLHAFPSEGGQSIKSARKNASSMDLLLAMNEAL